MKKIIPLLLVIFFLLISCSSTSKLNQYPLNDNSLSVEEKFKLTGIPKIEITEPEVIYDAESWKKKFVELINESNDYIIITTFLSSESDNNKEIFDALVKKAKEGVRIYYIEDSCAPLDATNTSLHFRPINRIKEAGVHLFRYKEISISRFPGVPKFLYHEHRKMNIFDGKTIVIGGRNITYNSLTNAQEGGDRDSMYIFKSPQCASLMVKDFIKTWNNLSWEEIKNEDFNIPPLEKDERLLTAYLGNQDEYSSDIITNVFGALINSAKSEILNFPLLLNFDENIMEMLTNAADRGVKIKFITSYDVGERRFLFNVSDILNNGMEYKREINDYSSLIHEKLTVIDDRYVVFGSSNFNYRSMNLSKEIVVVVDDRDFAKKAKEHFKEMEKGTEEITIDKAEQWKTFSNYLISIWGKYGG